MNKLNRRLFLQIAMVLILLFSFSFLINNYFLSKYYLHEKKIDLLNAAEQMKILDSDTFQNSIKYIENEYGITVIAENYDNDVNNFNESIRKDLAAKGITLNKFWITEDNISKVIDGNRINLLYNQGKLNSSFLTTLFKKGNYIILAGSSVAHDSETIEIVNKFNLYLILISLTISFVLIWHFCRKILMPIGELKNAAKDIANLKFVKTEITTKDEISELGDSINEMSYKLEKSHMELNEKNENLKTFISNISHELKTPLALIKAYIAGIQDGLDDGTYMEIIEEQTNDISNLVDTLLYLSKYQSEDINNSKFDLEEVFFDTFEKYKISIKNKNIDISIDTEGLIYKMVNADKTKIAIVFNNFISNAIKYNSSNKIDILFKNTEDKILFSIENELNDSNTEVINKIWEPFYVIDNSRSKEVSGTGLGLAIVKAILEKHGLKYGINLKENKINFYVLFQRES